MESISVLPITKCRSCQYDTLTELFSLGIQSVSDFVKKEDINKGHKVPITLVMCDRCKLIQQLYTAPQDFMYTRHYWYRSGTTQTMRDALRDVVCCAIDRVRLSAGDVVLDIGSNDGSLLRYYPSNCGLIRVGIEPASNLQEEGKVGVDVLINDFWSANSYSVEMMRYCKSDNLQIDPRAKIITACGMFYDLENPNQFIGDVAKCLHPDGIFVAQLMCAKQTYEMKDIGNFCHEHLEFFTLESLDKLLLRHKLRIVDIEENATNGGSYRLYIKHTENQEQLKTRHPSNEELEGLERVVRAYSNETRLLKIETWKQFYRDICAMRDQCVDFIKREVLSGRSVWVYGASTKGNVILQFYGLDYRMIEAACDRSGDKQGKYTVGTGIPILNDRKMREANPDYCLLLPYAFLQEFIKRESVWRSSGGSFIVPIPSFHVV